jgi:hypothetical protein
VAVLHNFNVGLALSTCLHCGTYIWELSYKVAKLFHQRIVSIWEIASIDSTSAASARVRRRFNLRHWSARFEKSFLEQSHWNLEIRVV